MTSTIPLEERRTEPSFKMLRWEWYHALTQRWTAYDAAVCKKLEQLWVDAYTDPEVTFAFQAKNKKRYCVELCFMRQRNVATGGYRDVRRLAERPQSLWEKRKHSIEAGSGTAQRLLVADGLHSFLGRWRNRDRVVFAAPAEMEAGVGEEEVDEEEYEMEEESEEGDEPRMWGRRDSTGIVRMSMDESEHAVLADTSKPHESYKLEWVDHPASHFFSGSEAPMDDGRCLVPGFYMTHEQAPDHCERYILDASRSSPDRLVWVCVWQLARQNGYLPSMDGWCFETQAQVWRKVSSDEIDDELQSQPTTNLDKWVKDNINCKVS